MARFRRSRHQKKKKFRPIASKANRKASQFRARAAAGEILIQETGESSLVIGSTDSTREKSATTIGHKRDKNHPGTPPESNNSNLEQSTTRSIELIQPTSDIEYPADDNSTIEAQHIEDDRRAALSFACCSEGLRVDPIICLDCHKLFHCSCVDLTHQDVVKIDYYICNNCEDWSSVRITHWTQQIPNRAKLIMKDREYADVEKIVGHKIIGGKRFFKIKWEGFKRPTFEPEENLDGCLDLLQRYCMDNDLERSRIIGYYGLTGEKAHDKKNWVTVDHVIKTYSTYEKYIFRGRSIHREEWSGELPKQDTILIIPYLLHLYVGLFYHANNICFIADGGNKFNSFIEIAKDIRKMTKSYLIGCRFDQQTCEDQCGSSAVLIALEFKRSYSQNCIPLVVHASTFYVDKIKRILHKYLSPPIKPGCTSNLVKLACPSCGKRFVPGQNKRLNCHKLKCSGNPRQL